MNAEERLQKITERMRDLGPTLPAAGELYRQIMELLPPPPGLIRPEDAGIDTVYRVECEGRKHKAWRGDPEDSGPWWLDNGEWRSDEDVTVIGRADLPEGAPMELVTVEDYRSAPEGTIVLLYTSNANAWQKFPNDRWYPSCDAESWGTSRGMTTFPRRVIRWGCGE